MKIKSITITGMHKVDKKTYEFNDGITYFIGENGSGKSTILEAVQLALLGYIPGYAKTNEAIMKHASGPVMSIEAVLGDDIKIVRTWTRSGTSVKSNVDVTGYDGELLELMGQVELPVFDFNEFRAMTANKLKDWFITFLPTYDGDLDVIDELKKSLGNRVIASADMINDTENWIKNSGRQGIDLVRALNAKFKEDQSYIKGQVSKLEGTIQSLIRYDDTEDLDDSAVRADMDRIAGLMSQVSKYNIQADINKKALAGLEELKAELPADNIDNDPKIKELKAAIEEINKKNEILKADYQDLNNQINELEREKATLTSAKDTCPYTNEFCETAAKLSKDTKEKEQELNKQIAFKKEEMQDCDSSKTSANDREIMKMQAEVGAIQSKYDRLVSMQLQIESSEIGEPPCDKTAEELEQEYKSLQDKLVKIEANKKYDELSEKVTADKFNLENDLEVLKVWIKTTDANGLQTELMNKPFENLADEMSKYLTQMFNKPVTAKFNLIAKANSFSFGLERDGQYIEFDYLSSGERCLFTLALMMCILDKSDSTIRTILIDDILDHLDSDNASYLFSALETVENIQFILAGVKECEDKSICKEVI